MRTKIIDVSMRGLQRDGLRFSVDTIASELKISKKTVYKYSQSKEDLAVAVYEKFYAETAQEFDACATVEKGGRFSELLDLYYRSWCMVRADVFNKYALNNALREFAETKHNEIRRKFITAISPADEAAVFIIDGAIEKSNGKPLTRAIVQKLELLI